jgi:hypothetical protein
MVKVRIYRNYRFIDKDPILDAAKTMVRNDEKLSNGRAERITGVTATTFGGWFDGGTRRPQNATITQAAAALGYVRRDELKPDGQVVVGFIKARNTKLDFEKEIEKQADWLLKQGLKKKRTTRKRKLRSKLIGY